MSDRWPTSSCPTSPGTRSRRTRRGRARTRRASSTCRSARRSTRRPRWCAAALADGRRRPGYPPDVGTAGAARGGRRAGSPAVAASPGSTPTAVLPTIGCKELVAWLPTLLGLGAGDVVGIPAVAYPTYDVGARSPARRPCRSLTASRPGPADHARHAEAAVAQQPQQPHRSGARRSSTCAKVVDAGPAQHGVVVASDECYAELDWREDAALGRSAEHPRPAGLRRAPQGLLAVYSLSKQSNLAGYRAAFVAGDPALVARLLEVRKHAGMIVPGPVQQAMVAALGDDAHVARAAGAATRRRRAAAARRRWSGAGCAIDHSEAGLYLWADPRTRTLGDAWRELAERGILVAPGSVLRRGRAQHVRVALTATDERIEAAPRAGCPDRAVAPPGCCSVRTRDRDACGYRTWRRGAATPARQSSERGPTRERTAGATSCANDGTRERALRAGADTRGSARPAAGRRPPRATTRSTISALLKETGLVTLDPGFVNTASCKSPITYIDGDAGHPALPRLPDRAAGREVHLPRGRLPADLRRAADARASWPTFDARIRRHTLLHEDLKRVLRRLPARRAPDGGAVVGRLRAVHLLPGQPRPVRPRAGRDLDRPAAGQAADDRGLRLQEERRPAVPLPRQLARRSSRTSCG